MLLNYIVLKSGDHRIADVTSLAYLLILLLKRFYVSREQYLKPAHNVTMFIIHRTMPEHNVTMFIIHRTKPAHNVTMFIIHRTKPAHNVTMFIIHRTKPAHNVTMFIIHRTKSVMLPMV